MRPASLPLTLRVPGQGLACGAGCWLPEGVSDPAPLPPQYLLGHWFLSRSLPQIFISDLLLPLDFVDAPQKKKKKKKKKKGHTSDLTLNVLYRTTPHHTTPHRTAPHHTTPHHTTPHHTNCSPEPKDPYSINYLI